MVTVHHRYVEIDGHQVFYREAGVAENPTVVLLHGAPASSHMFRELIPLLSDRYRVIAPDYLGFGYSDSPSVEEFDYTFDALAGNVHTLLGELGVDKFAIYVQDYGAPVGWRLALRDAERVTAIITQNGNAYEEGFVDSFWAPLWTYAKDPNETTEAPLRAALTLEAIRWQYVHGLADPSVVSPDAWTSDLHALERPGNTEAQLKLFREYPTNVDLYPQVHAWFRKSHVPLLAVWGENDEIFGPAGATAFQRDLPEAEIRLVDGAHFLLESHLDEVAGLIRSFLRRVI